MDFEIEKIRDSIRHKKRTAKKKKTNYFPILNKVLLVILLTIITLIVLKSSPTLKAKFYHQVYENNIGFAQINSLYQKYFGTPIPFNDLLKEKTKPVFNEKLSYTNKEKYLDGVKLTVSSSYMVPSLESGMVIFSGEKEGYGNTVIIEQVNGVEVWYSNLKENNIKIYDYIEKGTLIGEATDTILYLVFKKDGTVLNYEDYI